MTGVSVSFDRFLIKFTEYCSSNSTYEVDDKSFHMWKVVLKMW